MSESVRELIAAGLAELSAAGLESPRLDVELLLAAALEVERNWLFGNPRECPDAGAVARYRELLAERATGRPAEG